MAPPTKTQAVIDLVHRLDELNAHRAEVVAELDAEIAVTMRELAKLTGEGPSKRGANGGGPKPAAPATVVHAASLELIPVTQGKKASFADLALDALRANPKVSTAELAKVLYGDDSAKSRDKTRAVLYFLASKDRIRRKSDEEWEVGAAS